MPHHSSRSCFISRYPAFLVIIPFFIYTSCPGPRPPTSTRHFFLTNRLSSSGMADEPTLPVLSNLRHNNPFNEESRKRPRSERAPPSQLSTSSDPAFFSSDDDPALDNYEQKQGRRKRRYVGTWFSQQPAFSSDSFLGDDMISEPPRPHSALAKRARREFRKLDSGIYMSQNEDSTAESSDNYDGKFVPRPTFSHTRAKPRPIAVGEQIARDRITECVEDGRETVDLR